MSFLPGMFPAGAAASRVVFSIAFQNSATSGAAALTLPAPIASGDLLVLFQRSSSALAIPAAVTPSGWINLVNTTLAGLVIGSRTLIDYRIADGSESGSSITGMDGNSIDRKIALQFRGTRPIAAVSMHDLESVIQDADPADQTINASGGVSPLIAFAMYFATAAVDPRGFNPAADNEIANGTFHFMKYKIHNASPTDHTISMNDHSAENTLASFFLQLS